MGRLSSALAGVDAVALGGAAIAGALERGNVPAADVQYVIMGHVLQAGCGQLPARQAAVAGGIAMDVPALTINKVCLSGLTAIAMADQLIRAGECDIVVAGGMESMSRAPHLLPGSRAGYKFGDVTVLDHMAFDGLRDAFSDQSMGALTEQKNDAEPTDQGGAGLLRREVAPAGSSGGGRRFVRAGDRAGDGARTEGRRRRRRRRGHPAGHHGGDPVEVAAGVPAGRHHHRRQRVADQRRCRRRGGHAQGDRRESRVDLAGRDRGLRDGCRSGLDAATAARQCHPRCLRGRAWRWSSWT